MESNFRREGPFDWIALLLVGVLLGLPPERGFAQASVGEPERLDLWQTLQQGLDFGNQLTGLTPSGSLGLSISIPLFDRRQTKVSACTWRGAAATSSRPGSASWVLRSHGGSR